MADAKVFKGVIWSSLQRFGTMLVSFVSNIVLARLLSPDDYGAIGMLMVFIAIANVFVDSGFGSALIQRKNATTVDYSTVFITNATLSLSLYLILFVCAPLISDFYGVEILTPLLRFEGLILLSNGMCLIQTTIMRKRMDFKRLATANLASNSIGAVCAISAAYCGLGVWSLAMKGIIVSVMTAIILWHLSDWRPSWQFSSKSFSELFSFGGFMLLSSILTTLSKEISTLIIGKQFKQDILGYVTQAKTLRNIASDSISSVISQVLYPDYSNNQDNLKEITRKLNFGVYIISYITVALCILLICIAKPLIIMIYSTKWAAIIPYFQVLCISGIFLSIQDVNYFVVAAKGKSKNLTWMNLIKLIVLISALYICGKYFGIYGVLWSMVGYSLFSYMIFGYLATSILSTTLITQLSNIAKCFGLVIVPISICYIFQQINPIDSNLIHIVACSILYTISFLIMSMIFKPQPFIYLKTLFYSRFHK